MSGRAYKQCFERGSRGLHINLVFFFLRPSRVKYYEYAVLVVFFFFYFFPQQRPLVFLLGLLKGQELVILQSPRGLKRNYKGAEFSYNPEVWLYTRIWKNRAETFVLNARPKPSRW